MKLYHGSPYLFNEFELTNVGESTGDKYGCAIYLTESEATAVHYSQPRHMDLQPKHYLYTVEIPELTDINHLISAQPVHTTIVTLVEQKLGVSVPEKVKAVGKEFRKWVGCTLTGAKKKGLEEEKRTGEFLNGIGILYNVWPTAQTKPDGLKNIAVFNPAHIRIIKVEEITIEFNPKKKKWILVDKKDVTQ